MTQWDEITEAIGVALGGDLERGSVALTACWDGAGDGDHAQRCVIAHYLADLQDDVDAEVAWDKRAVAAYARLGDGDLAAIGITSARGMAPSLHLNLGDGCLRHVRVRDARRQLDCGLATVDALGDDGYGDMIRTGLLRLRDRVRSATAEVSPADGERSER